MVNLRKRRNRPRLTGLGILTVIDDYEDDGNNYLENKEVWAELGLGSGEGDECAGKEFHLTHYWETPNVQKKQKRINKRKYENPVIEPDLSASVFLDAHYKSLVAQINSAEGYSLVVEGVNDSSTHGDVVPSKSTSSDESQRQQFILPSIATHHQAKNSTDLSSQPLLPHRCSSPPPSPSSEIVSIIMESDDSTSEAVDKTSELLNQLSVERRTVSSSTENEYLNQLAKSVRVQPMIDQICSLHDQLPSEAVLRDVTSTSTNVDVYQKNQKRNAMDESDEMHLSMEEIIKGGLRPSFGTSKPLPFTTSTPLRPDVALTRQFGSLRSQHDSPLIGVQPSHSQINISSPSQQRQSDNETHAETSHLENTLWKSTSLHNNSVILKSAYWELAEQKPLAVFPADRPTGREDTVRNLSIYEEDPDRPPFFLSEFNDWSKKYAKDRDFKREVLFLCKQKVPIQWTSTKKFLNISAAKKLGEGTYGEVFSATCNGKQTAVKIIPIDGSTELGDGQRQNLYSEVQLELVVSKELSELTVEDGGYSTEGFIKMLSSCITKGRYPKKLLSAWDSYADERETFNINPEVFPSNQCYCVLAFELGGRDLEVYDVRSIEVAYSIMVQIITALAVAEDRLQYEHRDLHVGNVLVSECDDHQLRTELIASQEVKIRMYGVSVKIIDFTLSRLKKGRTTIFRDLSNEEDLFTGEGDLQFDIYRLMRKANGNNWARFNPKTNIMWLVYLSRFIHQKMVENVVGAEDQRERFLRLFQSLHRFDGSLSEWVLCSGARLSNFMEIV